MSSRQIAVMIPAPVSGVIVLAAPKTRAKSSVPKLMKIRNIASEKPKSPMRFTTNAFLPASVANFSRK